MRVCAVFSFVLWVGGGFTIENGRLMMGENGHSDCLDRFSHSTENSGEPLLFAH
jgi:hypothetical protein